MFNFKSKEFSDFSFSENWKLLFLFAVSGFAALIYQTVWQRALFQYFGVNIESITIIVSIFMFGLGVGSLIGGKLSKNYPEYCLRLFILCEVLVAIFGIFSLDLINNIAENSINNNIIQDSLTIYSLLAFPTIMMGATLPLLVSYLYRIYKKVGTTVSVLYFINTLGSALACFFTVNILFLWFGLQFSIYFAVSCNLFVAYLTYTILKEKGEKKEDKPTDKMKDKITGLTIYTWFIAASTAFVFMSHEILWFRLYSHAVSGRAVMFPYVLGIILLGIALGSFISNKYIKKYENNLLGFIGVVLLIIALINYLINPIGAGIMYMLGIKLRLLGLAGMLFVTFIISLLNGLIFPALNHHAIKKSYAIGSSVSGNYFANIIGSTLGPLFTGFYLLEHFTLEQSFLIFAIATTLLGLFLFLSNKSRKTISLKPVLIILFLSISSYFFHSKIYHRFFENLMASNQEFKTEIQNRHGVLHVAGVDNQLGDVMLGGGIYDGRFNTKLKINSNGLQRAYIISSLHNAPKKVLMIGVATGSWARILSTYEKIDHIDAIEINPGYLDIIKNYPTHSPILNNPKVTIHVDDGRRWLKNRPEKKYDYIVMNTTYYYRSQINNILSVEFLTLLKTHLKENGVLFYNSTSSPDVPYTTAHVFNHVANFWNHIAASDTPINVSRENRIKNLKMFNENGKRFYDESNPKVKVFLDQVINANLSNKKDLLLSNPNYAELITDDSLASEYKTYRFLSYGWIMRKIKGISKKDSLVLEVKQ